MKSISLPVIPNCPVKKNTKNSEGLFKLKKFGTFNFIQNVEFDDTLISYDKKYQNDQSNSPIFREHLENVYSIIKSKFKKGDKLIEVGCGKGSFLDIVEADGFFNYEGYDSAYEGKNSKIFSRYLTKSDRIDADIIVLRHVLEHIKSPHSFLKTLKQVFGSNTRIFIEVPQFSWIEKNKVLFDFTYEHVNYFTTKSLCSLFSEVTSCGDLFGGQYQYCLGSLNSLSNVEWNEFGSNEKWREFNFNNYLENFSNKIKFLKTKNRIWIWGGSTKGVLFLKHLLDISPKDFNKVAGVVDINKKKQGFYTPSTNIPIISPAQMLAELEVSDFILVMNINYLDEIRTDLKEKKICSLNIASL